MTTSTTAGHGAEGDGTKTESKEVRSPEAVLRRAVLGHLVEYWYSQDEMLELSAQWKRYEHRTAKARAKADAAFAKHEDDLGAGVRKAVKALSKMKNVTDDQRAYAFSAALRDLRPETAADDDGYANTALKRVRERRKDLGLLSAQLVSLVADFELFVLRVTTAWLTYNDDHLAARERKLTFREISELDSIEQLRESMVQAYLEDLMRKSASGWFGEFCKMFGVSSIEGADDFTTQEVFQHRHIIVHHGGLVSRQYLEALSKYPLTVSLGDHIPVDLARVASAANALACVAHSIAISALAASSKQPVDREQMETEAGELTYILLLLGRNVVVDRFVSGFNLDRVSRAFSREQIRVNGWIAKRRLGTLSAVAAQVDAWDVSGAADSFKLAKLVLTGKRPQAVAMAKNMIKDGRMSSYSIASWPLFEEIRDEILASAGTDEADEPDSQKELGSETVDPRSASEGQPALEGEEGELDASDASAHENIHPEEA